MTIITTTAIQIIVVVKLILSLKRLAEKTRIICYNKEHQDSLIPILLPSIFSICICQVLNHLNNEERDLIVTANITAILVILVIKVILSLKRFAEKTRIIGQKKEFQDSLIPVLLPSVFSICICLVNIFSMTWAWFSININNNMNTIKTAQYYIEVEVKNNDVIVQPENGEYILPNGIYNVTLTARGGASTGYCKIKILDGEEIYTEQLNKDNSITFTIEIKDSSRKLSFYPMWGTYNEKAPEIVDGTLYIVPNIESINDDQSTELETDNLTEQIEKNTDMLQLKDTLSSEDNAEENQVKEPTDTVQSDDTLPSINPKDEIEDNQVKEPTDIVQPDNPLSSTDSKNEVEENNNENYSSNEEPSSIEENQDSNIPIQDDVISNPELLTEGLT